MPARRSGRGRESRPEVQEGSGGPPVGSRGPPGGPGGVERPAQMSERGREASRRSGSCQDALSEVQKGREARLEVREG